MAARQRKILYHLLQVSWKTCLKKQRTCGGLFKENAEVIVIKKRGNPLFSEAIQYIQQNNDELLRVSDEVTGMFGRIFSKKVSQLRMLLIILLGFDVFIFLIGCIMAANLARHLRTLSKLAKRIVFI